jgi:hypothetical protein
MKSLAMMSRYFRKDRIDGSEVKSGPKDAENEADVGKVLDGDMFLIVRAMKGMVNVATLQQLMLLYSVK